ncbi:MAG: Rho termination factor N-terminal domain-containing protein, partial [Candidatus Nanopelagicales bacterium]
MTDTISIAPDAEQHAGRGRARGGGLSSMLMPELKKVAHELGLSGVSSMKKSDLIAAISAAQGGAPVTTAPEGGAHQSEPSQQSQPESAQPESAQPEPAQPEGSEGEPAQAQPSEGERPEAQAE